MTAALLLALAVAAQAAETPDAAVARVMARVTELTAQEHGKDAGDIGALDQRALDAGKDLKRFGWHAAAPLGAAARDKKNPAKVRLFAVEFLAKIGDPAAYLPLSAVLEDAEEEEQTRSAAAQDLEAVDVPPESLRRTVCATFAQKNLPSTLADDLLVPISRLGCADPAALEKAARVFGPRPEGRDLERTLKLIAAVSRSRGEAARTLLNFVNYYPAHSSPREAAIAALPARKDELVAALPAQAFPIVTGALRTESDVPKTAVLLLKLTDVFGPDAADILLPFASHPDAEVLTEAAEALARRKDVRALPALESVLKGALTDPRFGPKDGRPDPGKLLARIEAAVEVLRLARDQRR